MSTEISVNIAVDIACIATSVGERKAILAKTHVERLLTVSRPRQCRLTIDRLSTAISTECQSSIDPVSTKYRPSVDRVSTDYWPSVDRYIDRYLSCREMMAFFFWKRLTYSMFNNFSDLSQLNGNLFSHMSFNQKRKLMYNWHVIPCDVTIKESWD